MNSRFYFKVGLTFLLLQGICSSNNISIDFDKVKSLPELIIIFEQIVKSKSLDVNIHGDLIASAGRLYSEDDQNDEVIKGYFDFNKSYIDIAIKNKLKLGYVKEELASCAKEIYFNPYRIYELKWLRTVTLKIDEIRAKKYLLETIKDVDKLLKNKTKDEVFKELLNDYKKPIEIIFLE